MIFDFQDLFLQVVAIGGQKIDIPTDAYQKFLLSSKCRAVATEFRSTHKTVKQYDQSFNTGADAP